MNRIRLDWTSKKQWGSEGLTHRADERINGDRWTFQVLSPCKGEWRAQAWRNGESAFFFTCSTVTEAKAAVQSMVDKL